MFIVPPRCRLFMATLLFLMKIDGLLVLTANLGLDLAYLQKIYSFAKHHQSGYELSELSNKPHNNDDLAAKLPKRHKLKYSQLAIEDLSKI